VQLLLCVTRARGRRAAFALGIARKHNTVYLLGSIHVLRQSDYRCAVMLDAYRDAKSVLMEVNLEEISSQQVQAEMLGSAVLPEGKTLPTSWEERYGRGGALAHESGGAFPVRSICALVRRRGHLALQLTQLGFQPEAGVEMYFMRPGRATTVRAWRPGDGPRFKFLSVAEPTLDTQAEYLVSSLEQAHQLPKEVDSMVAPAARRYAVVRESAAVGTWAGSPPVSVRPGGPQPQVGTQNRSPLARTGTTWSSSAPPLVGPGSVIRSASTDGIGATQR